MNTVPAGAAEVEPHVLVAEGEPRQLRGGVADVIHLPVRRKHHIQQVEQHILVPLVPEDGLEPRIGEDVDITPGGGVPPVRSLFSSHRSHIPGFFGQGTATSSFSQYPAARLFCFEM